MKIKVALYNADHLEYAELIIANQGYVMMSRDLKYWQELNSQLNEGTFEEGQGCMGGFGNDMGMR